MKPPSSSPVSNQSQPGSGFFFGLLRARYL
jgi:hypothetical protein